LGRPAIFLDRDGVINRARPGHVRSWSEFEFMPRSLIALREIWHRRSRVIVVTNQSVVGRGLISNRQLAQIHRCMCEAVARAGGHIEAVLACCHDPAAACGCRKPAPGLLLRAESELSVDLQRSVMIGDSPTDVEAARAAGCDFIQIPSDNGGRAATVPTASDLLDAVELLHLWKPGLLEIAC
jgi:histidinol-phosphate phosphatase family protein